MSNRELISVGGNAVAEAAIKKFSAGLRGPLIRPDDSDYESARWSWNRAVDRHPGMIVRCGNSEDVVRTVNFARSNELLLAVRSGGHSFAGHSTCDAGVVLDLSSMRVIHVNPAQRVARAQAGMKVGEFDRAAQPFGLATVMGGCADVGIGGLTLGGGQGPLSGLYGLACDNLLSVEVVTADGRVVIADPQQNIELFWGMRGGAGNLGIATAFEYRLHPVSEVLGGMITYPIERAKAVLRFYRDYLDDPPDELTIVPAVVRMPEGPLAAIVACYCGDLDRGERVLRPLRNYGSPLNDAIKSMSYPDFQATMEQYNPTVVAAYRKSNFARRLTDAAIDLIVESVQRAAGSCFVGMFPYRGAVCRVGAHETAFPIREPGYDIWIDSYWTDPRDAELSIEWTDGLWHSLRPFVTEMVYVNNLSDEGDDRAKAAFGSNYEPLVALKTKYDPTNFFRMNQNIKPTV